MPLCIAAGTAWGSTWTPSRGGKGAVAYHIASSECATLKQKGSQVWCKRMLEEGAAAVIGPVDEPYVQAFPVPEVFFGLLVEGSLENLRDGYEIMHFYSSAINGAVAAHPWPSTDKGDGYKLIHCYD